MTDTTKKLLITAGLCSGFAIIGFRNFGKNGAIAGFLLGLFISPGVISWVVPKIEEEE